MDANDKTGCVLASKESICLFWDKPDSYKAGRRAVFGGKGCAFLLRAKTSIRGEKGVRKAMRKTALAFLLCLAALLLTMGALAQEAGQVYRVASSEEWNNAIKQIEYQSETDATVILTADIGIFNNQYKYTIGVAGKHITVKARAKARPIPSAANPWRRWN